ncbi:MAG: hypothetical protein WD826_11070 [Actinomycetota bacterium]
MDTCDHPIKLGSIMFTMVEPTPGNQVDYNRWYERDHQYGGVMIGPFSLAVGRFVATRDLKALRYPDPSPIAPDRKGSYVALYWILDQHHDDWWKWGRKQVFALHKAERMFPHREHIHTQLYRYDRDVSRDDDGVPPELALDRRFPGMVATWCRVDGDRDAVVEKLTSDVVPGVLAGTDVAMCLTFKPFPMPPGQPSDVPSSTDDEQRFLQLWFCERDPSEIWDVFEGLPKAYGDQAEILLASPFKGTIPGTDTYTDELW